MRTRLTIAISLCCLRISGSHAQEFVRQDVLNPTSSPLKYYADLAVVQYPSEASDFRTFAKPLQGSPFTLGINQATTYDDNVRRLPNSQSTPGNLSRGDLFSQTNILASSNLVFRNTLVKLDALYGVLRYKENEQLNTDRYLLSGRTETKLGNDCAFYTNSELAKRQIPFEELATFRPIDINVQRIEGGGRCRISGHFGALLSAGAKRTEYGDFPFTLNNSISSFARLGFDYDVSGRSNLGIAFSNTTTDFTDRTSAPRLLPVVNQQDFQFLFQKVVSPKTAVRGYVGFVKLEPGEDAFTPAGNTLLQETKAFYSPTYTIAVDYLLTPKTRFSLQAFATAGPPQGVVADVQKASGQIITASYRFSPKINLVGTISNVNVENQFFAPIVVGERSTSFNVKAASATLQYKIMRPVAVFATYRYTNRHDNLSGQDATSNAYLFGIDVRR